MKPGIPSALEVLNLPFSTTYGTMVQKNYIIDFIDVRDFHYIPYCFPVGWILSLVPTDSKKVCNFI